MSLNALATVLEAFFLQTDTQTYRHTDVKALLYPLLHMRSGY